MGVLYIDRGFVSINGTEVLDVKKISLRVSDGTKYTSTMTRNRRNKGTVKGNREIHMNIGIAVQSGLGTPKLEDIDYNGQSVAMTFEHGGDRYTLTDLDYVDDDHNASAVGTEGDKGWNFLALDIIDQVGNSALFNSSLGLITS